MTSAAQKSFLFRKLPLSRLQVVSLVLLVYVVSYAGLMNRRSPAIDYGKGWYWISFQSSFRFAPHKDGYPISTLWNYFYYPLDKVYFGMIPSHRKYGDWKDVEHSYPF
jgi:hypothetical protein